MKLSRLIENLYQKIFIGIVVQQNSIRVCVQMRKGKRVEKEVSKVFEISNSTPSREFNTFVKGYMEESPYSYVAVLNDIMTQGAVPTCSMHEAEQFADLGSCVTLCNENKWMAFADKSELNALQKRFRPTGLDFIFSPFFTLAKFFEDKIEGKTALLILVQANYLSLCVFSQGQLLFANHYATADAIEEEKMSGEIEESTEEALGFSLDDDLAINLDDIDALDELDALDDLDNLEDLDDLDDLDDLEDFEESLNEAVEESEVALDEAKTKYDSKIDNFSDDYKRFQLVQAALHQFYNDDKYNNQFVEETYIADACDIGQDLTGFLEEELFVSVFKRTIDLEKEMVNIAIIEAQYAI